MVEQEEGKSPGEKELALVIEEDDFDDLTRSRLSKVSDGAQVLDEETDLRKAVFDQMPAVIAKRLRKIVPADFRVSEIQLQLSLDAKLWGVGVGGDVTVKLVPSDEA